MRALSSCDVIIPRKAAQYGILFVSKLDQQWAVDFLGAEIKILGAEIKFWALEYYLFQYWISNGR